MGWKVKALGFFSRCAGRHSLELYAVLSARSSDMSRTGNGKSFFASGAKVVKLTWKGKVKDELKH